VCYFEAMLGARNFIWTRSLGGLLAVCVAYMLAIQALMASVGLGMSAALPSGQADFVVCSFAFGSSHQVPVPNHDQNEPDHQPQCPFCFIAAQSAGHPATIGEVMAFPAYAGLFVAGRLHRRVAVQIFIPPFRRMVGDPRAPPSSSV
jgi:hypothetical protein